MVAWRHETIFLEFGRMATRYFAKPGAGWEQVLQFANSVLQDQVFFVTDWPVLPFARMFQEHSTLPWKPVVREKIVTANIEKL